MAGKDIRAGRAYVELTTKDKLMAGLKSALGRMRSFASATAKISLGIGAAAAAGAAVAVKAFASMGSELYDAASRTGASAEALSALKYAADQTGSSLADVEVGMKKMAKTIVAAGEGSKTAVDALSELNLTASDLDGKKPDQQFALIAERISAITDPTRRAAIALEIFGRSGTNLLPMMAELGTLSKEAQDAGLIVSSEDAAAADRFGDMLERVWKQAKMVVFHVGAGIANAFLQYEAAIGGAIKAGIDWVKNSRQNIANIVAGLGAGVSWMIARFKDLGAGINRTFDGALTALGSGQFKLAGELAVGQLKIAWLGLKSWMSELWNTIGNTIVSSQIKAIAGVQEAWIRMKGWFKSLTNAIGDSMAMSHAREWVELNERQLADAKNQGDTRRIAILEKELAKAREDLKYLEDNQGKFSKEGQAETEDAIAAIQKERDAKIKALEQIDQKQDALEAQRLAEDVNRIQEELEKKRAAAAQGAPETPATGPTFTMPEFPDADDIADAVGQATQRVFDARGTFNAAALGSLAGGKEDRIAKATEETAKNTKAMVQGIKFTYQA